MGWVVVAIGAAKKRGMRSRCISPHPGIVSGGDKLRAVLPCPAHETAELEIAIARDARIGRAAVQIIGGKRLHYGFDELRTEVEQGVRNAKRSGDFLRAAMVRTDTRAETASPHAQGNAVDVIALFPEQCRGNRAVGAAAHSDNDFFPPRLHRPLEPLIRFEWLKRFDRTFDYRLPSTSRMLQQFLDPVEDFTLFSGFFFETPLTLAQF